MNSPAVLYSKNAIFRFLSNYRRHLIIAARLMSFKISLTIADLIVLFVYAPTQIIWISTYYVSTQLLSDNFCNLASYFIVIYSCGLLSFFIAISNVT